MKKHSTDTRNIGRIASELSKIHPEKDSVYGSCDDMGMAALFATLFKNEVRYNVTAKEWFVYTGKYWREDTGRMETSRRAKYLQKALFAYVASIDTNRYNSFIDQVVRLGDKKRRDVMIQDAADQNYISSDDFDADPNLFNCNNCVLNLKTMEKLEHSPELLLSKIANVDYNPIARSPKFEQFLSEIMMNDEEKINYLQKIFGYALTAEVKEEEMYIFYGPLTRNGKSTLIETISHMMGSDSGYAMAMTPETLAVKNKNSSAPSSDIARLNGCRFLYTPEPQKKMLLNTELIKALTGHDKITARFLYQREQEFYPVFKLIMNTNYLPMITDDTVFASNRIRVISFDRHFEEHEQDKGLKAVLRTPGNLSGILNWCLDGLRKYREEGLEPPMSVRMATDEYRHKSDKVGLFVEDALIKDPNCNVSGNDVYDTYGVWCERNGYGTEGKQNFFSDLRSKGLLSDTGTVDGKTTRNVVKGYNLIIHCR